jgi:undecaprenyl diphosphate synthase
MKIPKHIAITLTLFAFSSENKNRCNEEVTLLFKLFLSVLKQEVRKLEKYNIRLKIIGNMSLFPDEVQKTAAEAQTLLANNSGLTLIIAANYGGRWDILNACRQVITSGISASELNEQNFTQHLSLENNAVDLLIRSSGERRISNFLLWNIAYSELYFIDTLWPDFNTDGLDKAIESFNHRDRRYGGRH